MATDEPNPTESGAYRDAVARSEPPSASELIIPADSDVEPVLSVVMPTMNEEEGIGTCFDRIESAIELLGVPTEIIVSDSSNDRTPDIARDRGAIVVEPDEPGYGYAYRYAFERTRGEYIVMGDADTTYDFAQIPRLLERLLDTDADIVMGSRLEGTIEDGAMPPLHKYVGNPALTRFLNVFYGAGVSDAHSGFRVFTRETIESLTLSSNGMEFASEMIMAASANGLTIAEVPIVYHEREGEETLESFKDGWRHVRFMLVNAPGYLFSIPGVVLGLLGVAMMAVTYFGVSIGSTTPGIHSMIAGSLLVISGYQIASLGLFATIAGSPIKKPTDAVTRCLESNLTLERGTTVGALVFSAGFGYAGYLFLTWLTNGLLSIPFTMSSLVAYTAIVVGLQTIFGSFFIGTLSR